MSTDIFEEPMKVFAPRAKEGTHTRQNKARRPRRQPHTAQHNRTARQKKNKKSRAQHTPHAIHRCSGSWEKQHSCRLTLECCALTGKNAAAAGPDDKPCNLNGPFATDNNTGKGLCALGVVATGSLAHSIPRVAHTPPPPTLTCGHMARHKQKRQTQFFRPHDSLPPSPRPRRAVF